MNERVSNWERPDPKGKGPSVWLSLLKIVGVVAFLFVRITFYVFLGFGAFVWGIMRARKGGRR